MRPTTRITCAVLALGGALALLATSSVQADTRYAAPGAANLGPTCPQANPCSIRAAIEGLPVVDGDTVLLEPGEYNLGGVQLGIADAIEVRPAQPGTRPRILNSGERVFTLTSGATLTGLYVESSAVPSGFGMIHIDANDAVVRLNRMTLFSPSLPDSQAIAVRKGGIELTNSGVYVQGAGSDALELDVWTTSRPRVIRNSTLIAEGVGASAVWGYSGDEAQRLEITNTIANGEAFGLRAVEFGPADLQINVDHSNVNGISDTVGDNAVVNLGAGNQSAPPLLANPSAAEFTELTGSPTIDAGLGDGLSGPLDLLGGPRVLGAGVDIGADEYPSPVTEPPVVDDPPETTITKGPKRKQRTKKKRAKAKFEFTSSEPGSSFECKLDKAGWKPCTSPYETKVKAKRKPRQHALLVRATDAAGKLDQTPAEYRWTIKRKR